MNNTVNIELRSRIQNNTASKKTCDWLVHTRTGNEKSSFGKYLPILHLCVHILSSCVSVGQMPYYVNFKSFKFLLMKHHYTFWMNFELTET